MSSVRNLAVELEDADLAVRLDPLYAPLSQRFAELVLDLLEARGGGCIAEVLDEATTIAFGSVSSKAALVLVRLFVADLEVHVARASVSCSARGSS